MRYETVNLIVGDEKFEVIHCLGNGHCECKSCKEKGKWSLNWTDWFYKLQENDDDVLCRECLREVLTQRRIDKIIKDRIEQGKLIEVPCIRKCKTGYQVIYEDEDTKQLTYASFKFIELAKMKKFFKGLQNGKKENSIN